MEVDGNDEMEAWSVANWLVSSHMPSRFVACLWHPEGCPCLAVVVVLLGAKYVEWSIGRLCVRCHFLFVLVRAVIRLSGLQDVLYPEQEDSVSYPKAPLYSGER